ncbi:hypothetical protein [Rhizobium cauense]|nr:hypothetical protein [Rhizobium cauense]
MANLPGQVPDCVRDIFQHGAKLSFFDRKLMGECTKRIGKIQKD